MMAILSFLTLCLLGLLSTATSVESTGSNSSDCPFLYLLNVQAYPDSSKFAGWDRGLDLVPGGHLAVKQINNRHDILPDHKLKVVDIDAEACGRSSLIKGLVNFYQELVITNNNKCIVGVIGLVCSSSTNVIARLVGHSNVGYIQMALSVSPQHRNNHKFPYLFHAISSSGAFNAAGIAIMKAFGWQRVGLIHDSLGFYFKNTALDFIQRIKETYPAAEVLEEIKITNTQSVFPGVFKMINDQGIRVSYWVVSHDQGAFSLCEAYKNGFTWPGHVYIMRFLDLNSLLHASDKTTCTEAQIEEALEGVFLLEYRLFVKNSTELFSGWTYGEFRERYRTELYLAEREDHREENVYANALYDQVWAYALAINNSLPIIASQNLSLANYGIGNTESISKILKSELKKLSFQGASARIEFDDHQQVPSIIDIFQMQNKSRVLIGVYNPYTRNVTFTNNVPQNVPGDKFETFYDIIPPSLGGLMLTAQFVLFCTITTNMVLVLWWRKDKDIKASSPALCMLIMLGCYLLCVSPILLIIRTMAVIENTILLSFMCNTSLWFESLGLDLILATLFFRLLRVYRIFKWTSAIKKYWYDHYVVLYVLMLVCGKLSIHVIMSAIDALRAESKQVYVQSATPPYYSVRQVCTTPSGSLDVWLPIIFLYSSVILLLVIFLAIQTRHVKLDGFKDTKKINLFVFLILIISTVSVTLQLMFGALDIHIGAHISEWLSYFVIAMICQMCLFSPKVIPLFLRKSKIYKGSQKTNSQQWTISATNQAIQ